MRVRIIGPTDAIPGGEHETGLAAIPRVGDMVDLTHAGDGTDTLRVIAVTWPVDLHNTAFASEIPEVRVERIDDLPEPAPWQMQHRPDWRSA